jgi:hypothetical protein
MTKDELLKMARLARGVDDGTITDPEAIAHVRAWRERLRRNARQQTQARIVRSFDSTLSDRQKREILELIQEVHGRKYETLKLYVPMPVQNDFHMSDAHIRVIRGGNRSGKTTASLVELAYALTGQHPVPGRYAPGGIRAIVVAKDLDKIAAVVWRILGMPGAFRMTEDPFTGLPRLEQPGDKEAGLKFRDAPPLIPRRLVKAIQWVSLKASQPKKLFLTNGSECSFYSSEADPFSIQGVKLDLAIFDEEVKNEAWFPEALARLVDRGGRFVWSATPQTGTQKLYDLSLKAAEDREHHEEHPLIEEFTITLLENPYISAQDKEMFLLSLDDEEQVKVRVHGEHAITGFKVYAPLFFPRGIHSVDPFPVPHDWTRFASIDPGAQVAAVLFAAVPPPKMPKDPDVDPGLYGDFVYLYDEILIKRCDAAKLADAFRRHTEGQVLHTILIDHHGGQLTEIGSGKTPEQQYKEAFKAAKIAVPQVGRYFTWGSDDLAGGILRVKEFLRDRPDIGPKLRIIRGTCPELVSAMARYQWRVINGQITDKPMQRAVDLCDSLRYLVMHPGVKHQQKVSQKKPQRTPYEQFQEFRARELKRREKKTGVQL